MEILADAELQGSKGDPGSLPDSGHHRTLVVLHQENLTEASLCSLVAVGCQLFLRRWQQEDMNIRGRSRATNNEWDNKMKKHPCL